MGVSTVQTYNPNPKAFLLKWLNRLADIFMEGTGGEAAPSTDMQIEKQKKDRRAFLLKVAAVLNCFNYPLFYSGIAFVIWLIVDYILQASINPAVYARIIRIGRPVEAILGPTVVGYWTNYLAIKMLFRTSSLYYWLPPTAARRGGT